MNMSEYICENCAICHEEINIEFTHTTQLTCQHNNMFHQNCIATWIETKHRPCCPYCRSEIILSEEQLELQQRWIEENVENRYIPPVYDAETERLLEEARDVERNRIQNAVEERIRQIRSRRV